MVAPVAIAAIPAAATVIAAGLAFLGIIFKNKFIAVIAALVFLYSFSGVLNLPPFVWIGIVVVMFFTIMSGGKK